MYYDIIKTLEPQNQQEEVLFKQIECDVQRTFRPYNLKFLNCDIKSGKNRLFNVLRVYALLDPAVLYT